jgi:uncharacterized integral membrane protein
MNHFPILPVLLPSLAGIAMLLPPLSTRLTMQRWVAWGVLTVLIAIGGILILQAQRETLTYALGGWQPPFGILFVVDRLAALLIALTAVLAFCAGLYSAEEEDRKGSFLLSAVPVSGHGHQWRFFDRRPFQSLRILRNPLDRVVCTHRSRGRARENKGGFSLRHLESYRIGALSGCPGYPLWNGRLAEHGRHGAIGSGNSCQKTRPSPRPAACFCCWSSA